MNTANVAYNNDAAHTFTHSHNILDKSVSVVDCLFACVLAFVFVRFVSLFSLSFFLFFSEFYIFWTYLSGVCFQLNFIHMNIYCCELFSISIARCSIWLWIFRLSPSNNVMLHIITMISVRLIFSELWPHVHVFLPSSMAMPKLIKPFFHPTNEK